MTTSVKVSDTGRCGTVPKGRAAGIRRPPREKTATWVPMVVPHELYRDLSAACEVCEGSRSRAVIDVDVVDEHMASAECSTKSDALKRELGFWASAALAWAQHRECRPTLN